MIAENAMVQAVRTTRTRGYLAYLVILMGLVAVMDQYLSTVKTTAIPYVLKEYGITASEFSWLESLYLIPTFFVFLLNGLNDLIGRRLSILVLVLLMGLSSLAIALFTPSVSLFMCFYGAATLTTVSNMWTIPASEEAPAESRAKTVSIVYVIGLVPLQAILPPLLVNGLGLDWRWMYGVTAVMSLPVLALWSAMLETRRYEAVRRERGQGLRRKHLFGVGVIDRRDMRYILISASIWICWLVNSLLYYWAGYYFMNIKGYNLSEWSLVLLAALLMAMLGGVLGGMVMDRLGRRLGLIVGCAGMATILSLLGFAQGQLLPVLLSISGFFASFSYTWIVVYVPEVFPTERRGACMGWTTTIARVAYVAGPALAALLLQAFPTMELFWVVAGAIMLVPILIMFVLKPYETKTRELEEIEQRR